MLARRRPGRPTRSGCAAELARLLDDDRVWGLVTPDERAAADGRASAAACRAAARSATASRGWTRPASPHTIQHDDLHGGNIVVGPAGDRFFDWGDAVVAHPFATLTVTFNSIAHQTGRDLDDPAFDRLRDAYLEAWTDVAPRDDLLDAVGAGARSSAASAGRWPGSARCWISTRTRWTATATPSPAGSWSSPSASTGRPGVGDSVTTETGRPPRSAYQG